MTKRSGEQPVPAVLWGVMGEEQSEGPCEVWLILRTEEVGSPREVTLQVPSIWSEDKAKVLRQYIAARPASDSLFGEVQKATGYLFTRVVLVKGEKEVMAELTLVTPSGEERRMTGYAMPGVLHALLHEVPLLVDPMLLEPAADEVEEQLPEDGLHFRLSPAGVRRLILEEILAGRLPEAIYAVGLQSMCRRLSAETLTELRDQAAEVEAYEWAEVLDETLKLRQSRGSYPL